MKRPASVLEDKTLVGDGAGEDAADGVVIRTLGELAAGFVRCSYNGVERMIIEIERHHEPEREAVSIRVRMWGPT